MLLLFSTLLLFTHLSFSIENVNLDVSYKRKPPDSEAKPKDLQLPTLPVPFIHIKSSSFEDVQRYAENTLQQHTLMSAIAGDPDEELDEHAEIPQILANINKLEAIRASLSTEERVTRAAITKGITTTGSYIPIPYPVSVNPIFS